jgi:hypothetical protein
MENGLGKKKWNEVEGVPQCEPWQKVDWDNEETQTHSSEAHLLCLAASAIKPFWIHSPVMAAGLYLREFGVLSKSVLVRP